MYSTMVSDYDDQQCTSKNKERNDVPLPQAPPHLSADVPRPNKVEFVYRHYAKEYLADAANLEPQLHQ